jgi:predicted 2-oxoglutarate/Fe(II)-dependent dioxygenase YbiX
MKELKDYIVVMNNIMPPPVADMILSEYKQADDWIKASIGSGEDLTVRNCKTIGLSFDSVIQKNQEVRKKIDATLYSISAQALKEYARNIPVIPKDAYLTSKDTGYDLLKYEVGDFYSEHLDFSDRTPRAISCSFMLNDDYEGGEFAFFNRELVYKLKKGSCIMFPSNFMYPHEIMPVTSGTRYSVVTWFV